MSSGTWGYSASGLRVSSPCWLACIIWASHHHWLALAEWFLSRMSARLALMECCLVWARSFLAGYFLAGYLRSLTRSRPSDCWRLRLARDEWVTHTQRLARKLWDAPTDRLALSLWISYSDWLALHLRVIRVGWLASTAWVTFVFWLARKPRVSCLRWLAQVTWYSCSPWLACCPQVTWLATRSPPGAKTHHVPHTPVRRAA